VAHIRGRSKPMPIQNGFWIRLCTNEWPDL
jgi:hypothetical protein